MSKWFAGCLGLAAGIWLTNREKSPARNTFARHTLSTLPCILETAGEAGGCGPGPAFEAAHQSPETGLIVSWPWLYRQRCSGELDESLFHPGAIMRPETRDG